jgi:hypothetical protein
MATKTGPGVTPKKALQPPAVKVCAACRHYWGKKRGHCDIAGRGVNPYGTACRYFKAQGEKGG